MKKKIIILSITLLIITFLILGLFYFNKKEEVNNNIIDSSSYNSFRLEKVVDNTKISIDIPSNWAYEESSNESDLNIKI